MIKSDQGTMGISISIVLIISVVFALGMFVILGNLSIPQALPCTHPATQALILTLAVMLILHGVVGVRFFRRNYRFLVAMDSGLILLAFWLGSYQYSPIWSSQRQNPAPRELVIITQKGGEQRIVPNAIITLGSSSAAYIQPVLGPGNISCRWNSLNGGVLDGQDSCGVVYMPPAADYDILKLSILPSCGFPKSVEQIRISILR